ncbi:MAG: hypothetical protein U0838_14550 [Chloroflexota bacterium]
MRRALPPGRRGSAGLAVLVHQLVSHDPEQPWAEAARLPAERAEIAQCAFERGRGDVLSRLDHARASIGERVHARKVTLVELGEGLGVGPRPLYQRSFILRIAIPAHLANFDGVDGCDDGGSCD